MFTLVVGVYAALVSVTERCGEGAGDYSSSTRAFEDTVRRKSGEEEMRGHFIFSIGFIGVYSRDFG